MLRDAMQRAPAGGEGAITASVDAMSDVDVHTYMNLVRSLCSDVNQQFWESH
jgi:hypothetical protein